MCTVTVSRSPPNDCPVVTVAASQPASRSVAQLRENQAGSAPPSCMTYTTVGASPEPGRSGRDRSADYRPASTAGRAECRSATTTGIPPMSSASRSTLVVRRPLLVRAEHGSLQRRVAGLDQVAGQLGIGRQPVGDRDHQRVTAGAQAQVERRGVEQHPVAGPRTAGQRRVSQRPHLRPFPGAPSTDTSSSTAPGHSRRVPLTVPFRHVIIPAL